MSEAAYKLNMHMNTFIRYAKKFGCYKQNQGGKNTKKNFNSIPTEDILQGKYPTYQTYKLKIRLIRENYIDDKCSICGWDKKRIGDEFTPCELHHLDGNKNNHSFDNLVLLCPNCHALTSNYRAKNKNRAHILETDIVNDG